MVLNIESHEGNIYLANIQKHSQGEKHYISDSSGLPVKFRTISHIKKHCEKQTFENVWLIQNTPYDEMIGLESATGPTRMPLHWAVEADAE
ncbi:DUF6482 family protein [Agarilytica rhodophyticola]|uniref:DUF6482 family protein n=1 Tax=Agarilytica rhodophyticola TaxID=1737490 RepID=UPI000B349E6E|nr:DUF6482 family protein [Agarilytica rhodophyticola]